MRFLALLAVPLLGGCFAIPEQQHSPGYGQTATMTKQRLSAAFQLCTKLCDLDGPRGRIEFRDTQYAISDKRLHLRPLREHTSFTIDYDHSVASCKGDGDSPLRCSIEVPGSGRSELVLDPGCATGRLADLKGSTPLQLQIGNVTVLDVTAVGIDLSFSDERGVALYGDMGFRPTGIDVFTRGPDLASPAQVLAISAIYALLKVRPYAPSECLIQARAETATEH